MIVLAKPPIKGTQVWGEYMSMLIKIKQNEQINAQKRTYFLFDKYIHTQKNNLSSLYIYSSVFIYK